MNKLKKGLHFRLSALLFSYAAGPVWAAVASLAAARVSSVKMASPSVNLSSCAFSASTGVSIRPMSR